MARRIKCPNCYSIKIFPGVNEGDGKCAECYGTGAPHLVEQVFDSFNILTDQRSKCAKCEGSGICQTCYGEGFIQIAEPKRRPPPGIPENVLPSDGYSCLAWFIGLVLAAIAVLFAVLTVIVTMPIWVGAIAVSVITAYLYSRRRIREIGAPGLGEARLIQVQRKRRTKIKVAPEFLQSVIRWNPDRLIVGGSGISYALLLGGILVLYNTDRVGKAMFAIAAVAGSILAWKSGRKVLEWRISEAVLSARQLPASGPANAAHVGFGLSCVAAGIILVMIVAAVVNGPAPRPSPASQPTVQSTPMIPRQSVTRTQPQRTPFRELATNSPAPSITFSAPPKFAEATPSVLPGATPNEQFQVFVNQPKMSSDSSARITGEQVLAFVSRAMQLEKTQELNAILANYAPRVRYFDNGIVDQAFIRKDKSDYYSRWPVRSYEISGNTHATELSTNLWDIRVPTKFRVVNSRGEWIDGDVLQILTVDTSGSHWVITAEDGEVTRREKGTGENVANNSPGAVAAGSSQAIGGGAYRGKGVVYRIPDLKTLVRKDLSNAWLYGEFAFERQSGNVAVCRTAATVLFVGKGTTKVNIEFERGFSVSNRILTSMRDPQLPLTYMLRAGPNDPIRLLRVKQNRDGTLEVFARSPIRLDMQ